MEAIKRRYDLCVLQWKVLQYFSQCICTFKHRWPQFYAELQLLATSLPRGDMVKGNWNVIVGHYATTMNLVVGKYDIGIRCVIGKHLRFAE